jgi:RNA polymerase sigma-70 factor (ECF subfamily)
MDACVDAMVEPLVEPSEALEQEFERRLADSSTLAFRIAFSVLRDRAEAEDVAQESFLRAYQGFSRLRDRERFRAWLARIAWRLALDRIRSRKRREQRELAAVPSVPQPTCEDLAASSEFQRRLAAAIEGLPEKLRLVLTLAAVEGHDVREVSRLLDLPEGTVKSRLHLARKRLLEMLR